MYTIACGVHGSLYKVAFFMKSAYLSLGNGLKNSAAQGSTQSIKLGDKVSCVRPGGMLILEI